MALITGKGLVMGIYFNCLSNYATFRGRASRKEFWCYSIINAVIIFVLLWININVQGGEIFTASGYLLMFYSIFTLLPTLAVMSRRWHDIGRTGAWVLLNFVPVVGTVVSLGFFFTDGDSGSNKYGRNPYEKKFRKK